MLYAVLTTFALVVIAWVLPWRIVGLWKSSALLLLCMSISLYAYYERGYSDGYNTKMALELFDQDPNQENLNQVHHLLAQHIQKHEEDALAYVILGRLHFASGEYPQAVSAFSRAYEDYPDDEDLWLEYAAALYFAESDPATLNELIKKMGASQS